MALKSFAEHLNEEKSDIKLVDDVVDVLDNLNIDSHVYDGGKNFNVSFKSGGTEYYIRPNDKGAPLFYIDADEEAFDSFKVSDLGQLKKEVEKITKGND